MEENLQRTKRKSALILRLLNFGGPVSKHLRFSTDLRFRSVLVVIIDA